MPKIEPIKFINLNALIILIYKIKNKLVLIQPITSKEIDALTKKLMTYLLISISGETYYLPDFFVSKFSFIYPEILFLANGTNYSLKMLASNPQLLSACVGNKLLAQTIISIMSNLDFRHTEDKLKPFIKNNLLQFTFPTCVIMHCETIIATNDISGNLFEGYAIDYWLNSGNKKNPISNKPLFEKDLHVNIAFNSLLELKYRLISKAVMYFKKHEKLRELNFYQNLLNDRNSLRQLSTEHYSFFHKYTQQDLTVLQNELVRTNDSLLKHLSQLKLSILTFVLFNLTFTLLICMREAITTLFFYSKKIKNNFFIALFSIIVLNFLNYGLYYFLKPPSFFSFEMSLVAIKFIDIMIQKYFLPLLGYLLNKKFEGMINYKADLENCISVNSFKIQQLQNYLITNSLFYKFKSYFTRMNHETELAQSESKKIVSKKKRLKLLTKKTDITIIQTSFSLFQPQAEINTNDVVTTRRLNNF